MILARYDADGQITGFQHVKARENGTLGEQVIEITQEQQDAYFLSPTTHGVVNGAFSNTWSAPVDEAAEDAARVQGIKQAASEQILAIAPEWKQRNMLARALELSDSKRGGPLAASEAQEEADIRAVWAQIKTIRQKSDAAEANGTQPQDIVW